MNEISPNDQLSLSLEIQFVHSNGLLPPTIVQQQPLTDDIFIPFLVCPLNQVYSPNGLGGLLTLHLAQNPIIRLWRRAIQKPFLFSSSDHSRHFFCSNPTLKDAWPQKDGGRKEISLASKKELFEVFKMRGFQTCGNAITTWGNSLPIGRLTTA